MNDEYGKLRKFVHNFLRNRQNVTVLEAGCGSTSHLHLGQQVNMVGIDISEKQLQRNTVLSQRILGDIQYHDFSPSSFDVIVCWDVLEHLLRPDLALHRFTNAVKEEGIIVLKAPSVFSVKGLITKYLPFSFHVFAYWYLHRHEKGSIERQPFRTYLRFSIAPNAIKRFAARNGLRIGFFETYDVLDSKWFKPNKLEYRAYKLLRVLAEIISFGKLGDSDYAIVLQKKSSKPDVVEPLYMNK